MAQSDENHVADVIIIMNVTKEGTDMTNSLLNIEVVELHSVHTYRSKEDVSWYISVEAHL